MPDTWTAAEESQSRVGTVVFLVIVAALILGGLFFGASGGHFKGGHIPDGRDTDWTYQGY